jgi:hypothetical protein
LIDRKATYSFVYNKFVKKSNIQLEKLEGLVIGTSLGEAIDIDFVLRRVLVEVERHEIWVDLLPLELQDFDVIFWMDWLSIHRA